MSVYFFTGAAIFSVAPLLYLFKIHADQVKEDPDNFNEIQKTFFIQVSISKILPALLIILGITLMDEISMNQLFIPLAIILITLGYGIYYILSYKKLPLTGKPKVAVNTLSNLALPFIFSIPIMASIFLFLMLE